MTGFDKAEFLKQLSTSGLMTRRALVGKGIALGAAATALKPVFATAQGTPAAPSGPKGGSGTLIVTASSDPLSFNPDYQVDDSGFAPCSNIYNTLMSLDGNYNIIPELANTWEVAADGLSITFNLVQNATWHDGTPVTSADVKFTFEKIVAETAAPAASLIGAIASVDTPDDFTAVVNLKQPSSSILGFISWYGTFILPAHVYEGTDWTTNPANQQPIGSGPFKFSKFEAGSSIELEANLDYFGEGPYLDKLIFQIIPDANTALQALLNGEVDIMLSPTPPISEVPNLEQTEGITVAGKKFPSVYYLGFNMEREITAKLEVRKAMAQAVDRDQIVQTALGGYGGAATSFYTSAISWATNTDPEAQAPAFDLEAAKAALDAAGYPVKDGSRFKQTLVYFTATPEYGDISTVLKEQFGALDIEIELVALEIGAYGDRTTAGDFDISLIDGFQGPDPANLRIRAGTGGAVNRWRYSNPEVDSLLDQGDTAPTQDERATIYKQIQLILSQDLPYVPLADVVVNYPYTDKVSGVWFDNNDPAAAQQGLNRFTLTKIES